MVPYWPETDSRDRLPTIFNTIPMTIVVQSAHAAVTGLDQMNDGCVAELEVSDIWSRLDYGPILHTLTNLTLHTT